LQLTENKAGLVGAVGIEPTNPIVTPDDSIGLVHLTTGKGPTKARFWTEIGPNFWGEPL